MILESPPFLRRLFLSLALLAPPLASAAETVQVSRGPGQPFKPMIARELGDLPGFAPGEPARRARFGGDLDRPGRGTGFFRVEREGARWWMADPEGYRFFLTAVNTVRAHSDGSVVGKDSLKAKFGDKAGWAAATVDLFRALGFEAIGAWSEHDVFRSLENPIPYLIELNLMKSYRDQRPNGVVMEGEYRRFLGGVPFVFDPAFEDWARSRLAGLVSRRDDPWLVGVFSDNELPFPRDALDRYLALPAGEPGRQAAEAWRVRRYAGAAAEHQPEIADEERDAFLEHVVDHYYATVRRLIREVLPNHLYLGSRLHGRAAFTPGVWAAAAPHVDVLSVNVYFWWNFPLERTRKMTAETGKPFMVTEWYAKGVDTGLPNVTGAGWLVPTQADRGRFYRHFMLSLLEDGGCVGSHWFCYRDNDPDDLTTDASNRDSNKGLVSIRLEPYADLAETMKIVNGQKHRLIDYFDARRP